MLEFVKINDVGKLNFQNLGKENNKIIDINIIKNKYKE